MVNKPYRDVATLRVGNATLNGCRGGRGSLIIVPGKDLGALRIDPVRTVWRSQGCASRTKVNNHRPNNNSVYPIHWRFIPFITITIHLDSWTHDDE